VEQPASDFDGAWKRALDQYFAPFLALFFPAIHAAIDWAQPVAFLDTELQQIVPAEQVGKQRVDRLVQVVRRDGSPIWVLVHIEVQSQREVGFAERMLRYHVRIFDHLRKPVVSLAVLGDEDAGWRPAQFGYGVWGCELDFRFPVVKLRDLDVTVLEATHNPVATLTLLHRDAQDTRGKPQERLQRKIARYRALLRQGYGAEDVRALVRFMEHLLRLSPLWAQAARSALRQVEQEERGMETFITSFEELARAEERRDLVLRLLERKVGPLTAELQQRVAACSQEQLLVLSEDLLDFTTRDALTAWLAAHAPSETEAAPPHDATSSADDQGTA
jgi:hypothetical protein